MPKPLPNSTLSLSLVDTARVNADIPDAEGQATTAPLTKNLWLAVHFPKLAVELDTADGLGSGLCTVAVEQVRGRSTIHTASVAAELQGIRQGMSLNAAYSLYPELQVLAYAACKQQRQLEKLANWAAHYSSRISIANPATLLVEVKGSARLFGGLEALLRNVSERLMRDWLHLHRMAVTPSPSASVLLASRLVDSDVISDARGVKENATCVVKEYTALRSLLADIPIKCLPLDKKQKLQLNRLGLRQLRDLWRLPRQDLARRYGRELLDYLDGLTGVTETALEYVEIPEKFCLRWPLSHESHDQDFITRVVQAMLQRLDRYLIQRDASIREYYVQLLHPNNKPSRIRVGFRKPSRDLSHLLALFSERLKLQPIKFKVTEVKLWIKRLHSSVVNNSVLPFSWEFLQEQGDADGEMDELLELFQARLGHKSITSMQAIADHRPEYAQRYHHAISPQEKPTQKTIQQPRPLWLLPDPHPLSQQDNLPCYSGALTLVDGPERIESGWWSQEDVRRDYYFAMTANGQRLWVYRELKEPYKWYLHGFFA